MHWGIDKHGKIDLLKSFFLSARYGISEKKKNFKKLTAGTESL